MELIFKRFEVMRCDVIWEMTNIFLLRVILCYEIVVVIVTVVSNFFSVTIGSGLGHGMETSCFGHSRFKYVSRY